MSLPAALVYYLLAFFVYVLLYTYYRVNNRKEADKLDLLKKIENIPISSTPVTVRKPFDQIKKEILSNCNFDRIRVIFGIDLSASNEWQGRKCFQGQSLHKTQGNKIYNPYQKAISQLGALFESIFPSNKLEYSCFGFGDEDSRDYTFFPIVGSGEEFRNYQRVLDAYLEQSKTVVLSGPTSFTPMIRKLISGGIHCPKDFAMLVIISDELKISHEDNLLVESMRALTSLPNTCLLIIGVGDGPWERMSYEEHSLRELLFKRITNKKKKKPKTHEEIKPSKVVYDNFHFVDFTSYNMKSDRIDMENYFARAVLTKLPFQLKQFFRNIHNTGDI